MKNQPLQALAIRAFAVYCVLFSADYVSAATFTASSPITVNGTSYNVTFNQQTATSTTFNDIYGTGSPTLTFTNVNDATAARDQIVANIPASQWLPLGLPSSGFGGFFLPFAYTTNGFNRVGANFLVPNGPTTLIGGSANNNGAFSRTQALNFSFATFQQVPVPEPSAIFGTLVFGLVGSASYLRRVRRAS